MKGIIRYSISLFLFWLVYFIPFRLFFLCYQLPINNRIKNNRDILQAFFRGYKLDTATSIILMGIPVFLALLYFISHRKLFVRIANMLVFMLLLIYAMSGVGDAGIYKEWLAKINVQSLSHFSNVNEVLRTISLPLQLAFVFLVLLFTIPFYFLYKKLILPPLNALQPQQSSTGKRATWALGFLILYTGLSIIGIRGGITNLPISQSVAYFSTDVLANDIAVNPLYNLLQDITIQGNIPSAQEYNWIEEKESEKMLATYFKVKKDSSLPLLQVAKPNIVYIILESWSANMISCLGGMPGCTPHFDSLSKEGILFTKTMSSGYVSDQGIPAILSGEPGLHRLSAINQPSAIVRMPSMSEEAIQHGYHTSFLYGGDLVFGNIKGYLVQKKYEQIIDINQLSHLPQGRLGVHDEFMFPEFLKHCNQSKQPFLNALFTLSTHMPYDFDYRLSWQSMDSDVEKEYSKSIHYADAALGSFFREAKKQAWYKNTLFVLISDHSHNTYQQHDLPVVHRHHIPMLWLGDAIKTEYKGWQFDNYVAQMDIPSTLCHQLGWNANNFVWSRNILNPYTNHGAYYPFYGGSGYVDSLGATSFQIYSNNLLCSSSDSNVKAYQGKMAKSFLRKMYQTMHSSH